MITVKKLICGQSRVCLNADINVSYNHANIQDGHNLTKWPTCCSNKAAQIRMSHSVVAEAHLPYGVTSQQDPN